MPRPTLTLLLLALSACSSADPGTDALSGGDSTAAGTTFGPLGQTGDDSLTASAPTTGDASATDNVTNASTGDASTGGTTEGETGGPLLPLDTPCTLGPAAPGRLAVITNDFIDPAGVHVLDLATRALTPNIAASPSDPALAWGDGKLVVIGQQVAQPHPRVRALAVRDLGDRQGRQFDLRQRPRHTSDLDRDRALAPGAPTGGAEQQGDERQATKRGSEHCATTIHPPTRRANAPADHAPHATTSDGDFIR